MGVGTIEDPNRCTAPKCDRPLPEGVHLCLTDLTHLEESLRDVRGTLAALGAVVIRSTTYTDSVGGAATGDKPVMFDEEALARGYELRELVNEWARYLIEPLIARWEVETVEWMEECARIDALPQDGRQPLPPEPVKPGPTDHRSPAVVAEWLATRGATIRTSEWAGDMYAEIRYALRKCLQGSDRSEQRVFAGMCPTETDGITCGTPLYALRGKALANCRTCGEQYDVADWRARALEAAGINTGTAAEVSRALSDPTTGEALPQGTIRSWVSRKLLTHVNEDEIALTTLLGQRVPPKQYSINEVQDLWVRMKASKYGNPELRTTSSSARITV